MVSSKLQSIAFAHILCKMVFCVKQFHVNKVRLYNMYCKPSLLSFFSFLSRLPNLVSRALGRKKQKPMSVNFPMNNSKQAKILSVSSTAPTKVPIKVELILETLATCKMHKGKKKNLAIILCVFALFP